MCVWRLESGKEVRTKGKYRKITNTTSKKDTAFSFPFFFFLKFFFREEFHSSLWKWTLPNPTPWSQSYSVAFALADWLADRSVEFTHRKHIFSDAHRDFLQEILTETTKNKFKMSWRPYGEPYPRTRVGRNYQKEVSIWNLYDLEGSSHPRDKLLCYIKTED